ncbi:MAG TPA: hypothetical protein VJ010_05890, partial [Actinomycetota bacterium]|nr:hypothetical protein [Actinomycetota bacterium]
MRALLAGMGAAEALAHPGEVRVLASFPRALYVATPGGIAALVAPGVGPGPLHVLLDAAPTPEAAPTGLAGVPVWRGPLPDPGSLAAALPLVLEVLASFPRALYVATPGGIAAFVGPGVEPGPLHVLLDTAPTREAARMGLAGVPVWRGALPDSGSLAAALPLVLEVLDAVAGSNLVPAERAAAA